MHKNAQKVEQKTQTKLFCHYTRLLHGKNYLSQWCFLRNFLTTSKPSRRWITAAKSIGEKGKTKKILKRRSLSRPKTISQNFDFCASPSWNVVKRDASSKKGKLSWCNYIFVQIKANLAEIQPKTTKMSKKHIFRKKLLTRSQWVNNLTRLLPVTVNSTSLCLRSFSCTSSTTIPLPCLLHEHPSSQMLSWVLPCPHILNKRTYFRKLPILPDKGLKYLFALTDNNIFSSCQFWSFCK